MKTYLPMFSNIGKSIFIIGLITVLGVLLLPVSDINSANFITVVALLMASYFLSSRFPGTLSFHHASIADITIAVIGSIGISILPFASANADDIVTFETYNILGKILFVAFTCVMIPIVEEVYFRGLLFKIISKQLGAITGAIITVAAFTLMHLDQPLIGIFLVSLSAILFTWLTHRSGSVIPAILAHSATNWWWLFAALNAASHKGG